MFCSECGKQIEDDAKFCKGCGAAQTSNENISKKMPTQVRPDIEVSHARLPSGNAVGERKSRTAAVLLAIFLGPLGLFYTSVSDAIFSAIVYALAVIYIIYCYSTINTYDIQAINNLNNVVLFAYMTLALIQFWAIYVAATKKFGSSSD